MNGQAIKKSVIVVIPARNEEKTIEKVINDVRKVQIDNIVVIDDLSTDQTAQLARKAGAVVLPLCRRLGAWGAIRAGLTYAVKHNYQIAVTLDADGQHPAECIQALVEPVQAEIVDVAIGSCIERGSYARQIAWYFFRKMTMLRYSDLTSGFRAYNNKAFSLLISKDTVLLDYQDIGVLLYLKKNGLEINEVDVEMLPRINGHSRIFASWFSVGRYLLITWILSLSKLRHFNRDLKDVSKVS